MVDVDLDKCYGQYAVIRLADGKASSTDKYSHAEVWAKRDGCSVIIDLHTQRVCDVYQNGSRLSIGIMGIRYQR
jgi:hypothetical protein